MSTEVHIRLANDKYNEKGLAPFLDSDFYYDIVLGNLWQNKNTLLTDYESELLKAQYYEYFNDDTRAFEPKKLRDIFMKIKKYLKENEDDLPFEIDIDYKKMRENGLNTDIVIHNSRCWIQGDSALYEVSEHVNIVNFPFEPNKVKIQVKIAEKIKIKGKTYFLKKTSRFEKYNEPIEKIINFCNYAINSNEKIYWFVS